MGNEFKVEEELQTLRSMRERVARLRSQLKELEADTYLAIGSTEADRKKDADLEDGVSKNFP